MLVVTAVLHFPPPENVVSLLRFVFVEWSPRFASPNARLRVVEEYDVMTEYQLLEWKTDCCSVDSLNLTILHRSSLHRNKRDAGRLASIPGRAVSISIILRDATIFTAIFRTREAVPGKCRVFNIYITVRPCRTCDLRSPTFTVLCLD